MLRGYCASNPVAKLQKPKVKPKAPGILTPTEAAALLTAAEVTGGAMLPCIALGLFCGLRSAELNALDWSNIHLEMGTVEVSADSAKTSERRIVDMPENLVAWLQPHAKRTGRVVPGKDFDWQMFVVRKAAGLTKWPKNAMRHSFASYHLAHHKNAALTATQLGHFGSTRTLISSYRNVVQPADAARFWSLAPSGAATRKIVSMSAA